jgi:hypothetical protein
MADDALGQWLYDAGWDQGVLLPALPWGINFHLDDPLTPIAHAAQQEAEAAYQQAASHSNTLLPRYGFARGINREKERLVIASQACDIVKKPIVEPTILALRAFMTDKVKILQAATTNSAYLFLLDPHRGLVADATITILVEKPVLRLFTPEPGAVDTIIQARFARWLAHRFSRPAIPENVVGAVIKPILDNLRQMQEAGDSDLAAFDPVQEVRMTRPTGKPPYNISLLFIVSEEGLPDNGIDLAHLVRKMRSWFNPDNARLVAWDARTLYQVSVGEYLDMYEVYLDHYTYQGQTVVGLTPLPLL